MWDLGLSFDLKLFNHWSVESLIYGLRDKFVVLEGKSDTIIPTSINCLFRDFHTENVELKGPVQSTRYTAVDGPSWLGLTVLFGSYDRPIWVIWPFTLNRMIVHFGSKPCNFTGLLTFRTVHYGPLEQCTFNYIFHWKIVFQVQQIVELVKLDSSWLSIGMVLSIVICRRSRIDGNFLVSNN